MSTTNYSDGDDSDLVIDDSKVFKGGGHAYGPCNTLLGYDDNARFMLMMHKCQSLSFPSPVCTATF